jgi:branched-chain amino acid transport system substrate-binding protein
MGGNRRCFATQQRKDDSTMKMGNMLKMGSAALVAAAVVSVSGISASSGAATTSASSRVKARPAANNTDPSEGVFKSSIKIGGIATLSSFASMANGADAVFRLVNKAGGIYGRKINFLGIQDDGGVPTTDSTEVNNLVESSHVFAIVPEVGFVFAGGTVITKNDVPFFGWGFSAPFCTSLGFGFNGCLSNPNGKYANGGFGTVFAKLLGGTTAKTGKTMAIVNTDNQPGHASTDLIADSAQKAGVKVAIDDLYIPTNGTTDYSPYAEKIIQSGASLVFNSGNLDTVLGLSQELRDLGYTGILSDPTAYDPSLVKLPALQNENVLLQLAPWQSSAPAVKQMVSAVNAYDAAAHKSSPRNLGVEIGYVTAEMFVQALKKTGRDLTRKTFLKALNSNWTFSVPGLAAKIKFPAGHQVMAPCMAVVKIEKGVYVSTQPLTCGNVLTLKK